MTLRKHQPLKLGTAKIDITPTWPVPLAGFLERQGVFEKVLHPLQARVLAFELNDREGRARVAVLVSADLIWWGANQTIAIKETLKKKWGIEDAAILLHATHNHSGPQTTNEFAPLLGTMDQVYVSGLERAVLQGVEQSLQSLQPVVVERGRGVCGIGINRRREIDGRVVMAPNLTGVRDAELQVVAFRALSGATRALIVHYTCHPTTTAENYVSSEFPGLAMQQLEDGEGLEVAMYLQGCCGDIRPSLTRGDSFYRGGDKEVCALGAELSQQVLSVLRGKLQPCRLGFYRANKTDVPLDFAILPTEAELRGSQCRPGIEGEWSRGLLENPERLHPRVLELSRLDLGKDLSLIAMNAEMVVEYGLFVKNRLSSQVLPVAYSNGMIGYVTTARQLIGGGYEPAQSYRYFGLPSSYAADSEARIHEALARCWRL